MKKNKIILAYHSIGECPIEETGAGLYTVALGRFAEQMEYVRNNGTVPEGDCPIISFDDGDITNYTNAFLILKEMALKAYFFIIGTKIGTPGYMNWNQIRALRDAGMTIGSHGMTHRILTELSDDDLSYELTESKKALEDNLKMAIDSFSIPRGVCSRKIIDLARYAGYKEIFTSDDRIVVRPGWDLNHFKKVLENGYLLSDKVEDAVKKTIRGVLGIKNYDKLRTTILTK